MSTVIAFGIFNIKLKMYAIISDQFPAIIGISLISLVTIWKLSAIYFRHQEAKSRNNNLDMRKLLMNEGKLQQVRCVVKKEKKVFCVFLKYLRTRVDLNVMLQNA